MAQKVAVTGFQPSGTLHIGNYLGAFKQAIELQGKAYQRFYFIADYHSLTQKYDPKRKADDIFNVAVDALA
ncbi:MAG: tryptophan--tRNA ligase, partial [bacterium]|nr:tryptophan--tRNA ligase [bacterium]